VRRPRREPSLQAQWGQQIIDESTSFCPIENANVTSLGEPLQCEGLSRHQAVAFASNAEIAFREQIARLERSVEAVRVGEKPDREIDCARSQQIFRRKKDSFRATYAKLHPRRCGYYSPQQWSQYAKFGIIGHT
jgi:hypothetical protein